MMSLKTLHERLGAVIHELLDSGMPLSTASREFRRRYIAIAKERVGGRATRAARILGINRNTVMNWAPSSRVLRRRLQLKKRK